jgi:hypothetical protein
MRRSLPIVLAILAYLPAPLVAQGFPLDRCEAPRSPLGYLTGAGEITYRLKPDGRPDTITVAVITAQGVSAGGLRSAAVRQLAACRMARPEQALVVRQLVRFDSIRVMIDPAVAEESPVEVLAIDTVRPATRVYAARDSMLEERPRRIRCERGPGPPPGPGEQRFSSRQEAEEAFAREARNMSGRLRVRVVIGVDGRVIRDSTQVLESTNPNTTNSLLATISSCRYAPARIGGIPVAASLVTGNGIEIRQEFR